MDTPSSNDVTIIETKQKIKMYIYYYLHGTQESKINKSTFFTKEEREEFKKMHNEIKHNIKLIETSVRLLRSYSPKKNKFYSKIMNKLFIYEVADIDSREIMEFNIYSNPVVGNVHNIKEQARVLHVINSIMNSNHISKIDPNFKSAKSTQMKEKLLVDMLEAIVINYLEC